MRFLKRKVKLPHLPLDESLPFVGKLPSSLKHWRKEAIQQKELVQELEQINTAIGTLREQQYELRRKAIPLPEVGSEKPHLPTVIEAPTINPFHEQELDVIEEQLQSLKDRKLETGTRISNLPTHASHGKQRINPARFRELAKQLKFTPVESENENSKSLLKKLQQGITELQQKWDEVHAKLQKIDHLSPQVNTQLDKLNQELKLLKKVSIERPRVINTRVSSYGMQRELDKKRQKRAKQEISSVIAQINKPNNIESDELANVNYYLKQIDKKETAEKVRYRAVSPILPEATSLFTAETRKRTTQETKQIIKKIDNSLSDKALRDIDQRIAAIEMSNLATPLVKREINQPNLQQRKLQQELNKTDHLLKRLISDPLTIVKKLKRKAKDNQRQIAQQKAREEVRRIMAKIDRTVKPVNELTKVTQELNSLENDQPQHHKIIREVKVAAVSKIRQDFLTAEKIALERKMHEEKQEQPLIKTKELIEIERKLAALNK